MHHLQVGLIQYMLSILASTQLKVLCSVKVVLEKYIKKYSNNTAINSCFFGERFKHKSKPHGFKGGATPSSLKNSIRTDYFCHPFGINVSDLTLMELL